MVNGPMEYYRYSLIHVGYIYRFATAYLSLSIHPTSNRRICCSGSEPLLVKVHPHETIITMYDAVTAWRIVLSIPGTEAPVSRGLLRTRAMHSSPYQ